MKYCLICGKSAWLSLLTLDGKKIGWICQDPMGHEVQTILPEESEAVTCGEHFSARLDSDVGRISIKTLDPGTWEERGFIPTTTTLRGDFEIENALLYAPDICEQAVEDFSRMVAREVTKELLKTVKRETNEKP